MMNDYRAVPSGLDISRRVIERLEDAAPNGYQSGERVRAIRAVNDILQGCSTRTAEELLAELEQYGDGPLLDVCGDIRAFLQQKELLAKPYDKEDVPGPYAYEYFPGHNGRRLKMIHQKLYDQKVKDGFPPNFFRESYFNHVTFYCLPKFADFFASELYNCKFAVCRIRDADFIGARLYSCEFYSSVLDPADFCMATLADTHFRDCELSHVTFNSARLNSCSTIDCTMDGINYSGATLNGCSFGRVTAGSIHDLDRAVITQGGATEEECRQNREAIYRALGVKGTAA